MSAENFGTDLIKEIKEEDLDVLLHSLQARCAPPKKGLGIPPIDNLLEEFGASPSLWHHANAVRNGPAEGTDSISIHDALPAIIEVTSISPCSGKTQLLYLIITIALLPTTFAGIQFNGRGTAVALLDLSNRISILRLRDVMTAFVSRKSRITFLNNDNSSLTPLTADEINEMIVSSLSHLHIFRPASTMSVMKTLEDLPTYLLATPSPHFSLGRPLGLLALSDMTTFLAQDRLDSDMALQTGNSTDITNSATVKAAPLYTTRHVKICSILHDLRLKFSAPIILTSSSPVPPTYPPHPHALPVLKPPQPAPYNSIRTLHLLTMRDRVNKFAASVSVEEMNLDRERGARWAAVRKSGFGCWVNGWAARVLDGGGGDGRPLAGSEAPGGGAGRGRFRFWVDAEGKGEGVVVEGMEAETGMGMDTS